MDDLDLTGLTDDQLVNLFRGCLREAGSRHPALRAAVEAAGLDEQERLRIIKEAGDREAAKLRAQERERLAKQAAEQVRAEHAKREAEIARHRAGAEVAERVRHAEKQARIKRKWIAGFADVIGRDPGSISLLLLDTNYGRRVLVNEGGNNRYASEHLVDYHVATASIKTTQKLVSKKPALIKLCAQFAALNAGRILALLGAEENWPEKAAA